MQRSIDPLIQRVELIAIEDEAFGVLPNVGLLHLNRTGRTIVELWQAGHSDAEIASAFAASGTVSQDRVSREIEALFASIARAFEEAASAAASAAPNPLPDARDAATDVAYRLFGHAIMVHYPDKDIAAGCHPILAPMQLPPETECDLVVAFEPAGDELTVTCGGASVSVFRTGQAALSALQHVVLFHDKPDQQVLPVVLHAGAVIGRKGAWLIGGVSGRGKSTLVSQLDAQGCPVLGDDIVPLDVSNARVFPMATSISVKESAWPFVSKFRPELMRAPPSVTASGKLVRYLRPLNPPGETDRQGHAVAGLLFPARSEGAAPDLRPVGIKQAMLALCDKFGRFPIDPQNLRGLVALIAERPRLELVYENAEDIMPKLTSVL